jgi:hypothetical protein
VHPVPRARECARAALVLAVAAALAPIALPNADAKKPWEVQAVSPESLTGPKALSNQKPWKPAKPGKTHDGDHGRHKGRKAELPKLPKVPGLPDLPEVTPPKVTLPAPVQAEPAKAVPTPQASTPAAPATRAPASSPRSGGSIGGGAPTAATPAGRTSQRQTTRRRALGARRRAARAVRKHRRARAHHAARKPATRHAPAKTANRGSAVTRTVRDIVEVVPRSVEVTLAALACLSAVLGGGYLLSLIRTRRLSHQRGELLQEVGLLQAALLPSVPDTLGAVRPSVAYRPAEGLAAGGDFYDALELSDGRSAFILGDVSGHGREALERTAFARYTLRAFLEAGLEPRVALQVAARVLGEHLGGEFVTVLLAIHDPADGSLTWASAGHPAPIVMGPEPFEPVTAGSSPPIGMGLDTGLRQTTIALHPGAVACMYTDGLVEARSDGAFMGRRGLEEILEELGDGATATALIEMVAARSSTESDDMAACLFTPADAAPASATRREEIVVSCADIDRGVAARFLDACRVEDIPAVLEEAAAMAASHDRAVLAVSLGERPVVEVSQRGDLDEQRAEAASRRLAVA